MRPDPVSLPGELWVISCFFNPMGYATKLENYAKFAHGLADQGVNLMVVEHDKDGKFQLPEIAGVRVIRLSGGDLMWQKERLFNIGLLNLPSSCDKVMFCDADMTFPEARWQEKLVQQLETYRVVQPFSHFIRMPQGVDYMYPPECPSGNWEGHVFHGFAFGLRKQNGAVSRFATMGCPGLSWAYRRSVLQECNIFDRIITGGGDSAIAYGMASPDYRFRIYGMFSAPLAAEFDEWRQRFRRAVRDSIGYVPQTLLHHWHGTPWNRSYVSRHRILKRYAFDPSADIATDKEGPWRWTSDKPGLHHAMTQYFADRQEDNESNSLTGRLGHLVQQITTFSKPPTQLL